MNYKELSQQEINKIFLKACKTDDIELAKDLLTSADLPVKAQYHINKQTGIADDKKEGFIALSLAVQYNSKKIYQYFLEEIKWFSTLTQEGKVEILSKGSYTNDIGTMKYLFNKFEETTKINNYQKPFILSTILDSVIDKKSDKVFDYLMTLPNEYKEHINTKNDVSLRRSAKTNPSMLEHMLNHEVYKDIGTDLYLAALEETKQNEASALILFKHGIKNNMFDIWLTKHSTSYIRDRVRNNVFQSYHDGLIKYMHEEQKKLSYPEGLIDLANKSINDYFYTENQVKKTNNKKDTKQVPVLEYAVKHKLLTKENKELIVNQIVRLDYKNLLEIILKYPHYGEDIDLNEAFKEVLYKNSIGQDKFTRLSQILELDMNKNIMVCANDYSFFKNMENIKAYKQNYDNIVKKVFLDYYFIPNTTLREIYKDNPEMLHLLKMKELNNKLTNESENIKVEKKKKNKI